VAVVAVVFLTLIPQSQVLQVALLVVLQLPLVVVVQEVRQLVRQELLERLVHPLLAVQGVGEVEQTHQAQVAQAVQEDFPEAVEVVEVEVHPQVVLVAMVRLVV
jgi:hypothetical protein